MVGVLEHRRGMMPSSVPLATYRLQLTPNFGFDQAAELVPYLKALGISHLYASPFLKARSGSPHGYDVVDHNSFNPELGGEDAFRRLCAALRRADMGLILDFVPNHMGVHYADNPWWRDLLEWVERYRGPHNPPRQTARVFKADLASIAGANEVIERGLRAYRPAPSRPDAVLALHHLLERQHYL